MTNVFALIKNSNIDIKNYIQKNHPELNWEKDKCMCPFHTDSKPSLSYNKKENFVHCFACGTGGDVITFTEKLMKTSSVEAAKIVLRKEGIVFDDFETNSMSDEQKQAYEQEQANRIAELEKRKALVEAEVKEAKAKAVKQMTPYAANLANSLVDNYGLANEKLKIFNQTALFADWRDLYVGFDVDEESVCILNRDMKTGATSNIKYRTKRGFEGKWIGWKDSTLAPFPFDYFKQHESNKVVICEGEKDALNLLSLNINCLTLGGVTASWETHKELLRDKIIYIMFDNDKAGYENAIKRFKEFSTISSTVYITLFFHINRGLPLKYDISDFIFEHSIKSSDDFYHRITYSSYTLTNDLIEDIEEYLGIDLAGHKSLEKVKTWNEVRRKFLIKDVNAQAINIPQVKGELDDKEMDEFFDKFKTIKKSKEFLHFKDSIAKSMGCELDEVDVNFAKMIEVKQTLLTNYRQTHITDMVDAFLKMGRITGHTFAKYHDKFFVWTGTHYSEVEEHKISDFTHQHWMYHARVDKKKQTKKNVDEILQNVKSKSVTLEAIKEDQERRVFVFQNGTLYISRKGTTTFKPSHDKRDAATNVLKFNYDANKKAPKWEKFLDRVLPNKADQSLLMEYIGYCFLPSHAYESFLFLYGKSGSNGKSVILEIVRSFFGDENVSSLQLQNFEGHELEALQNKIINIGTEIDARGLDKGQLSTLKALVSPKDQIQINPKNRQPYSLKADEKPKLLFSGNEKPKSGIDDAVFRRMLLLGFDAEIKDDEKIRNLEDRFSDEMSGILNMALDGLKKLIEHGKFSKSDKMLTEMEEYKDEVNPLRRYIADSCLKIPTAMVPKRFVYAHYKEWISEKGGKALSEQSFWTRMKSELKDIDTVGKQLRVNIEQLDQEQPRFVCGIFIKKDEIYSFPFANKEVKTDFINYDIESKAILSLEEE